MSNIVEVYYIHDDMVIRRKHTAYSYWNLAVRKWYGDNDLKYLSKKEISKEEAMKAIEMLINGAKERLVGVIK